MTVTIAIVGGGKIARDAHIPAITGSDDFTLAAAVTLADAELPGVPNFRTIAAMKAALPEVTAVALCTPPRSRHALALQAIDAGLGVRPDARPQSMAEFRDALGLDEATTHALTDPMTGLPNARSLQKHFEKEAGRAARSSTNLQLLMLDLDGFKAVNDSFGHKIGDKMLAEISQVIRGQLRDYDFLARYGGDEFVAIVPEMSREDVMELCDRIESAVSNFKLSVSDDVHASVGVSLGSASYPVNGETFDQMIISADKVMYRRKVERKRLSAKPKLPVAEEATLFNLNNTAVGDNLIVELDESHVLASAAVN